MIFWEGRGRSRQISKPLHPPPRFDPSKINQYKNTLIEVSRASDLTEAQSFPGLSERKVSTELMKSCGILWNRSRIFPICLKFRKFMNFVVSVAKREQPNSSIDQTSTYTCHFSTSHLCRENVLGSGCPDSRIPWTRDSTGIARGKFVSALHVKSRI